MKAPKFREFISEKVQRSEIQVAILTKVDADSKNVVSKMIEKECERRNIPCYVINTSEAWVSKNDLEKSILWCIDQEIKELELFGFSHGRDDQHLANILIMRDFSNRVKIKMYTNNSILLFINKNSTFSSNPNQKISIFSFNQETKITTTGLKYSLQNSPLTSPSHGISNLATGTSFSIKPSDWILVLIHYYK